MPYLDTSIVVAYYLPEALSERVQSIYDGDSGPTTSDLVDLELFSALSLRVRTGELARQDADRVARLFVSHLEAGLYARVVLTASHHRSARDLIARFDLPLKAPDALHLAVASAARLPLFTADDQLARNARALGIDVTLIQP